MVKRNWKFRAVRCFSWYRRMSMYHFFLLLFFSFIAERETSFHFFLFLSFCHFFFISSACRQPVYSICGCLSLSFVSARAPSARFARWHAKKRYEHDHLDDRVCDVGPMFQINEMRDAIWMEVRACLSELYNEMYCCCFITCGSSSLKQVTSTRSMCNTDTQHTVCRHRMVKLKRDDNDHSGNCI